MQVKNLCRLIDRVTVKGSNAPMYLYTYDVPKLQSFGGSIADDIQLDLKSLTLYDYWKRVRPYTGEKFRLTWQMAMHAYLGGADGTQADWKLAKTYLTKCREKPLLFRGRCPCSMSCYLLHFPAAMTRETCPQPCLLSCVPSWSLFTFQFFHDIYVLTLRPCP